MAIFQLNLSKTFTYDTADWDQEGRDALLALLPKVKGASPGRRPSDEQLAEAFRELVAESFEDFVSLDDLSIEDTKIVCIDDSTVQASPPKAPQGAGGVTSAPATGAKK